MNYFNAIFCGPSVRVRSCSFHGTWSYCFFMPRVFTALTHIVHIQNVLYHIFTGWLPRRMKKIPMTIFMVINAWFQSFYSLCHSYLKHGCWQCLYFVGIETESYQTRWYHKCLCVLVFWTIPMLTMSIGNDKHDGNAIYWLCETGLNGIVERECSPWEFSHVN